MAAPVTAGGALANEEPALDEPTTADIEPRGPEPKVSDIEPRGPETVATTTADELTIAERREPATVPEPLAITRTSMEDGASERMRESAEAVAKDDAVTSPTSPSTSPKEPGKMKSWLKTKFSRRMSKGQKTTGKDEKRSSFVGGATLTGASTNNSTASIGAKSSSVRDVANANTAPLPVASTGTGDVSAIEPEEERGRKARRSSDVSALSSDRDLDGPEDEEFQEARDNFDEDLAPPPTFPAEKSSSPVRSTKFTEDI